MLLQSSTSLTSLRAAGSQSHCLIAFPLLSYRFAQKFSTRLITSRSHAILPYPKTSFLVASWSPPASQQLRSRIRSSINIHRTNSRTMSSDEAYGSFLEQANQDTGSSRAPKTQTKSASATASKSDVHPAIAKVDAYYTSETDEPFEPVSFDWDGGDSIDESSFEQLLSADADVTALTPKGFDPKNQYSQVITAVGEAGKGEVHVFKVDFGGTRLEYYVVSVSRNGGQIQGVKALAVES